MKKFSYIINIILLLVALLAIPILWYKKYKQVKPIETKLIIGTSADFPPFSFRDSNDNIVGFDIDIAKEVLKRINMPYELIDRPFSLLIPQIQVGQIDLIAAGITPTKEREKNLRFTKPYLGNNPLIIITLKKLPIKGVADLKGKNVIVNTGYTADMYMSKFPETNLIRLPKVVDAILALKHSKADAFVTASLTIEPYIKKEEKKNFNIIELPGTSETSALGVSKKTPQDIFDKIQKALDDMDADGSLDALKKKWKII